MSKTCVRGPYNLCLLLGSSAVAGRRKMLRGRSASGCFLFPSDITSPTAPPLRRRLSFSTLLSKFILWDAFCVARSCISCIRWTAAARWLPEGTAALLGISSAERGGGTTITPEIGSTDGRGALGGRRSGMGMGPVAPPMTALLPRAGVGGGGLGGGFFDGGGAFPDVYGTGLSWMAALPPRSALAKGRGP
jgi:hypothetical protein